MPRNKRANGYTYIPVAHLEYNTKQSLYVIAVQDAKKVQDACAKWQDYLKLQELLSQLR